jgi:hypothetical protein
MSTANNYRPVSLFFDPIHALFIKELTKPKMHEQIQYVQEADNFWRVGTIFSISHDRHFVHD